MCLDTSDDDLIHETAVLRHQLPHKPASETETISRASVQLHRANTYQLQPTAEQSATFAQWAGACRFVYNLALDQRRDWYRPRGDALCPEGRLFTYATQQRELTQLRAEVDWIRAVPVHALQMSVRALDSAFQRFFAGVAGYPKPKRKGLKDAFSFPDPNYLGFKRLNKNRGAIRIPKVGWVKFIGWRELGGELRSITISRQGGKWFAAVAWRKDTDLPSPSDLPAVGIDRGVSVFAALSNGEQIPALNARANAQSRLLKMQVRLSRKEKFSSNWHKLRARMQRLHAQVVNARNDFLHKNSTTIAKNHGVVRIEALRIKSMTARGKAPLNRAILDQGWGRFAWMLDYKLTERGGRLEEVPAAYTSQRCPACGAVHAENRKSRDVFACVACGHAGHADVVAANNILQARAMAVAPPKRTLLRVGKRKHIEERAHAFA